MITFDHVSKIYPDNGRALDGLSLHIDQGEFVFVVGRSGAGKTTFLKMLLREDVPTEGTAIVLGQDVSTLRQKDIPYFRRQIGMVFQDFRLIPTMTVYDNVAFAMRVTNMPEKVISSQVPYVLGLVGLDDRQGAYPHQLSGGEQQRVALARALAHDPKLLIADEPTANIDPEMSYEVMELLTALNSVGITVVVVTHEQTLIQQFHKRIITITDGRVTSDIPASDDISEGEQA